MPSPIIVVEAPRSRCIYCGAEVTGVDKGEHVIQDAIGGVVTLRNVCGPCNAGFSDIDKELVSRSPLSIAAAVCIENALPSFWLVESSPPFNLFEARPDFATRDAQILPQIHFEPDGPYFCGPSEEMRRWGYELYSDQLTKIVRNCFHRHEAGDKKWLHEDRVKFDDVHLGDSRFVPRAFFKVPLEEMLAKHRMGRRCSLHIRFRSPDDRSRILHSLDNWRWKGKSTSSSLNQGRTGQYPTFFMNWEGLAVVRALMKSAVNLVHYVCETPNVHVVEDELRIIRDLAPVPQRYIELTGFVDPNHMTLRPAEDNGHSFRIHKTANGFTVYSSYFGGRICAVARVRGSLNVTWAACEVKAPLESRNWHRTELPWTLDPNARSAVRDIDAILRAMEIRNSITIVDLERRRPKRNR